MATVSAPTNLSPNKTSLLVNELQLGDQLGQCVHSRRRADFSLMLAMLTEDVREHSQFFVPKRPLKEVNTSDDFFRKVFHLPAEAPLTIKDFSDIHDFSQAGLVEQQNFADIQLKNILKPLPLSFRDKKEHIPTSVLTDSSVHCQQRHRENLAKKTENSKQTLLNSPAFFNAKAWLDNIQTTLVNATSVQLHTA